ncbi:MAG: PDZ domain-containing protein [Planctomycetaceae bacterium]|nr:PDZ domain-containing protein [Planctomycetaceae bacterium]
MSIFNLLVAANFCLAMVLQDTPAEEVKLSDFSLVPRVPLVEIVRPEVKLQEDIIRLEDWYFSQFQYQSTEPNQAQFGVHVRRADETLRKHLKVKSGLGLVVELIVPDSGAAQAGVQVDDVLLKLDDQWLINSEQFTTLVQNMEIGQTVKVTLIREGLSQEISVTLTKAIALSEDAGKLRFDFDLKFAPADEVHSKLPEAADCAQCHQPNSASDANSHYPANR